MVMSGERGIVTLDFLHKQRELSMMCIERNYMFMLVNVKHMRYLYYYKMHA